MSAPLPSYTDADLGETLAYWTDLAAGVRRLGAAQLAWILALEAEVERREITAADLAEALR